MPPTEKISREDIIRSALAIVEAEGLSALTARRVGAELGASTAPVYRQFASMDDLAQAVMEQANARLIAYTTQAYTDTPFLNMGTGIALFARDHPRLYRALFLETDRFREIVEAMLQQLTDDMRRDPRFTTMSRARRAKLLETMWTYTHGLASQVAVGLTRNATQRRIVEMLGSVGGAIIRDALEEERRG